MASFSSFFPFFFMQILRQNLLNSSFFEKNLVHSMRLKLFVSWTIFELKFELKLEFDKLEFQALCSNIEWNSSLTSSSSGPNLSLPNLNSKNSLTYKIVSLVCWFPKIFLKSCYLANFAHVLKLS